MNKCNTVLQWRDAYKELLEQKEELLPGELATLQKGDDSGAGHGRRTKSKRGDETAWSKARKQGAHAPKHWRQRAQLSQGPLRSPGASHNATELPSLQEHL